MGNLQEAFASSAPVTLRIHNILPEQTLRRTENKHGRTFRKEAFVPCCVTMARPQVDDATVNVLHNYVCIPEGEVSYADDVGSDVLHLVLLHLVLYQGCTAQYLRSGIDPYNISKSESLINLHERCHQQ